MIFLTYRNTETGLSNLSIDPIDQINRAKLPQTGQNYRSNLTIGNLEIIDKNYKPQE